MNSIRSLLSSAMVLALLSSSSFAAETSDGQKIHIRGNDKENYSRIVFDWGNQKEGPHQNLPAPAYTTQKTKNNLVLTFADNVRLIPEDGALKALSRVTGYKIIAPNQVEIEFQNGLDVRNFATDNRLFVDIKGAAQKDLPPVNLTQNIEAAAGETEKKIESEPPKETAIAKPPEPAKSESGLTISLTSTSATPLAVYERNGYLWMVQGKENVKIPPQVSGDLDGTPKKFESIPAPAGLSIFRLKIGEDIKKIATGGGLAWKIEISDSQKTVPKPLEYKEIANKMGNSVERNLLWPSHSSKRVTELSDPDTGDKIFLALSESAQDFTGKQQHFVDFDSLPSVVGLAIIPKVDDLKIAPSDDGIVVSREGGLNIASNQDILAAGKKDDGTKETVKEPSDPTTIFDFKNWQVGTKYDLSDNQRLIMAGLGAQTESKKAESLIDLAKLVLSFNYAPEALGYLELAESYVPEIGTNPEFMALMGAAQALSWRPKEAFSTFSNASLNDIDEIKYWRAYTLAKLDDWQQAAKILPDNMGSMADYPDDIKTPLLLTLLEVALREGNIAKAKTIFNILDPIREDMNLSNASSYDYLLGEFDRQTGKAKEATELWKNLSSGLDDLYRAKSRFAATMMQLESKEITIDKAIDNLEGLRYAWRGDDLEVSINKNLADIYLTKGEAVKALTLMDLAHSLNPKSDQGKKIDEDMRKAFKDLFSDKKIKDINPVDILILYNDFSKLIPEGPEGEALTRQLAERMATADLLPRAIAILKKQVDGGLTGSEGAAVNIRLATLQTLDVKPDDALQSLDKAETLLKGLPSEEVISKQNDIGLLRAKAYSLKGKPDEAFGALALLPQDEDSLHLRADIAWRAKKWQDAADSLEQLVQNRNIDLTMPLDENDAELILNWGVALYLADNRSVLANLRERYSDAMLATTRAKKFDVVTRPRQGSLLADRETINSIIDETVIFKDFLKSFRATDTPPTKTESVTSNRRPANRPSPANIPEELQNKPDLKTDEFLGD